LILILTGLVSVALANGLGEEPTNELPLLSEYASPIILAQGADENVEWEDYTYLSETNFSVEIDQNVQGTGFHSSYKYASVPDLAGNINEVTGREFSGMVAQDRSHGSGTIDKQFKLSGYSFFTEAGWIAGIDEVGVEDLELDDDLRSRSLLFN
jgi:hypothetical protein